MTTEKLQHAHDRRVEADIGLRVDRQVFESVENAGSNVLALRRSREFKLSVHYLKARVGVLGGLLFLNLVQTGISASVLITVMAFIQLLVNGGADGGKTVSVLGFELQIPFADLFASGRGGIGILFFLTALLVVARAALHFWQKHVALKVQNRFMQDVRRDTFEKLLALDIGYFTDNRLGDVAYLQNTIIGRFAQLIPFLQEFVLASMNAVVVLAILFRLSFPITMLLLAVSVGLFVLLRRLRHSVRRLSLEMSECSRKAGSIFLEMVYGIRLIRQGGQEKRAHRTYLGAAKERENAALRLNDQMNLVKAITESGGALGLLLLVVGMSSLTSLNLLDDMGFTIGYFVVAWSALANFQKATDLRLRLAQMGPYLTMVSDFLEDQRYNTQSNRSRNLKVLGGVREGLSTKDLTFAYPDGTLALDGITLDFPKGTITALVGMSGSGKSSLMENLAQFQYPTKGAVLVDGRDVSEFDPASYRKRIGYATQDMILFHGTIAENLLFLRPEATDAEVTHAAEQAQAQEFIAQTAAGYDTVVGERGMKVSGGQRQRLVLARVLLQNPDVVLLDESTSAMDLLTESKIYRTLEETKKDRVTIVVAHRLSAIAGFDNIVVLNEGTVVEKGTHEELISKDGLYHSLYRIQQLAPQGKVERFAAGEAE